MEPEDIDDILTIEQRLYLFPWSRTHFNDSLAADHSAWVCRTDTHTYDTHDTHELVGYLIMMLVLDEAHLLNIGIAPAWQGQGLGMMLLKQGFHISRLQGATRMYLEVRSSNASGKALYQRAGFEQIGLRRGYYPAVAGREDAIVMGKDL